MGKRFRNARTAPDERFWPKVAVGTPNECWPWLGATAHRLGYGQVTIDGKHFIASRIAWEITYGPIPVGAHVCHHCDNPPCCNPRHLFLGDTKTNLADARRKGRMVDPPRMVGASNARHTHPETTPRGERHGMRKLTEDNVREIREARAAGETLASLGQRFGVSLQNIWYITKRRTWALATG